MKVYGLIGYPLTHSFSKTYFNEKFKNEKEDAQYLNIPISSIKLFPGIIKMIKNLAGLNVTSPYKEEIIPFLDELDSEAKEIGAVNVIKIVEIDNKQKLIGYNTDVYGFIHSVEKFLHEDVKYALILGTGGAAKAIAHGLKELNINFKFVTSKKSKKDSQTLHYSDLNLFLIKQHLLIINATPLGLYPKINIKPKIPYELITKRHILYDLIYNPVETQFMKEGRNQGAIVLNGYEMLKLQAEKAWEIFNS